MIDEVPPNYREYRTPAALRGLVECGWTNAVADGTTQEVLPDACMDLVWTGTELLVAGPDTAPHPYRPPPGHGVATGLRFAPGRLPGLLGAPAAELRDRRVPVSALHPAAARQALARIEGGADPVAALRDLALALPGTVHGSSAPAVVRYARAGRSAVEISDALGWTSRSLHRRCLDWFGYGPSVLRRILRFREAERLLRAGVAPAAAAALAGYADQPHLSREVRALAGASPRQLATGAGRPVSRAAGRTG